MQCQTKGTVCLHNYHVGNYRAHAHLAIKHSIPLQRSLKQFQVGVPVQRREQLPALLTWVAALGLWVSMSWIRWIHTAYGPAQRHILKPTVQGVTAAHPGLKPVQWGVCLRWGFAPQVSRLAAGPCLAKQTCLWVTALREEAGSMEVEICPCCQQPCWSNSVWTSLSWDTCPAGHGVKHPLGFAGFCSCIAHPHGNNFNRPAWHPYFKVDSREMSTVPTCKQNHLLWQLRLHWRTAPNILPASLRGWGTPARHEGFCLWKGEVPTGLAVMVLPAAFLLPLAANHCRQGFQWEHS